MDAEHRAQLILDVNLFGQAAHVGSAHLGHHFTCCIRHAERLVASPDQNDRTAPCHTLFIGPGGFNLDRLRVQRVHKTIDLFIKT